MAEGGAAVAEDVGVIGGASGDEALHRTVQRQASAADLASLHARPGRDVELRRLHAEVLQPPTAVMLPDGSSACCAASLLSCHACPVPLLLLFRQCRWLATVRVTCSIDMPGGTVCCAGEAAEEQAGRAGGRE